MPATTTMASGWAFKESSKRHSRALVFVVKRTPCHAALLAAALALVGPVLAQETGPAAEPSVQAAAIDGNGVLILVRSTLLALDHANKTGNYTVLRELGASGFETANTAAGLAEIFAELRAQNLDLSAVAVLDPTLYRIPQIVGNGMMHIAGFIPSGPLQVNFELLFAPVQGGWELFGLSVNLGETAADTGQPPEPADSATLPLAADEEARRRAMGELQRQLQTPSTP